MTTINNIATKRDVGLLRDDMSKANKSLITWMGVLSLSQVILLGLLVLLVR